MKSPISGVLVRAVLGIAIVQATPAHAGPYADELSKCLVRSTSSDDKALLVQWIFAIMVLHPQVSRLATVSDAQRAELSKGAAALFQNLLTRSCLSETREALKYEGNSTIEASFRVLGQVAARELFANPKVAAGMADFTKYIDQKSLENALRPTD